MSSGPSTQKSPNVQPFRSPVLGAACEQIRCAGPVPGKLLIWERQKQPGDQDLPV